MGEHTAFLLLLVATLTLSSEVNANGEISVVCSVTLVSFHRLCGSAAGL